MRRAAAARIELEERELDVAIAIALAESRQVRRWIRRKGWRECGIEAANDNRPLASLSAMSPGQAAIALMKYTGPVGEAFLNDKRLITGIMGPVGSAKTTKCVAKMIKSATWQLPGPDAVYRAKWAVVRDTYGQLRKTVLATWHRWFPKELGLWSGEAPFEHTINMTIFAGVRKFVIELIVIFAAIGENKAEDVMRGWEVTGIWLNEGDLVDHEVFSYACTRVGRYPTADTCKWRGVMIDMNAPDIENWTYTVLVDQDLGLDDELAAELREELGELFGVGFHVQPGGRSKDPPPENIENLPKGYYAQQIMALSKRPWLVRRMVDNEFGPVRNGQPVFTEYQDSIHCAADKLAPIKNVPITIAADQGGTPAAVIGQRNPANGQIRVLGEVVLFADNDEEQLEQLGATAFGKMVGRYIITEFPDCELNERVWCDPAGAAGEGAKDADPSWRQNFQKGLRAELGNPRIKVKKAPTSNRLDGRLQAVRSPMLTLVEGGQPGYLICPVRCKILRRGFKGKYVIARTQLAAGNGRFQSSPLKNDYSHVQDANQYLCLTLTKHGNGDADPSGFKHPGARDRDRGRREVKVESNYNVHRGRAA